MPLIVFGVLVFGGLLALIGIIRNKKTNTASSKGAVSTVIYLPSNIELEKIRRNIL